MNMHQPDLGDHRLINAVAAYAAGSSLGWAPRVNPSNSLAKRGGEMDTYTYDLQKVEDGPRSSSPMSVVGGLEDHQAKPEVWMFPITPEMPR